MSDFLAYASVTALMLIGILLIFIVLLQRGRGGGLAGALGGAGGQSALGTKAGDVFTKITIGLAAIWILVACLSIFALRYADRSQTEGFVAPDTAEAEAEPEAGSMGAVGDPAAAMNDPAAVEEEANAAPATNTEESPAETESTSPGDETNSVDGPSLGTAPPEQTESAPAEPAATQ